MPPSGYERLLLAHAVAVVRSDLAPSLRRALIGADGAKSTLYEYAARQPKARALMGRGAAYAVGLPQTAVRVVVRRNRHGGLFASITGDRFIAPRAPHELESSLAMIRLGVPTPEVVAYVLYPPGGIVKRCDVATGEIPGGRDLSDVLLRDGAPERAAALEIASRTVATLSQAGCHHPDLNAKNVLLTLEKGYVVDVDRVSLGNSPDVALERNLGRLGHSLRKWRERFGARITEREIETFESDTRRRMARA